MLLPWLQRRIEPGKHVLQVLLICAGALMAPLDSSVNVAFPAIVETFRVDPRQIQWIVLAFVIAQTLAALACGRLGDLVGYRRVFLFGLAACVAAHWAVAQAVEFSTLIFLRALQGAAVGMAVACAPALVKRAAGPERAAPMLAFYTTAISAGVVIGPLLGGLLVHLFGWPGVFLFRVGLSAAVLSLAIVWLTPDGHPRPAATARTSPAIAWHVLASARYAALQASSLMTYLATFTLLLWIPFLLSSWGGLTIIEAGAVLSAFPVGAFATGLLAAKGPWVAGPTYSRALVAVGQWVAAVGLAAAAACSIFENTVALMAALLVCGAGLGYFQAGYIEQTMRWMPADNSGVAGSLVASTRLMGLVIGVPILSACGAVFGITATLAGSAAVLAVWALCYRIAPR